jgi:hypothetical protein
MNFPLGNININNSFYPAKTATVLCHNAFSCNG